MGVLRRFCHKVTRLYVLPRRNIALLGEVSPLLLEPMAHQ